MSSDTHKAKILIVDDNENILRLLRISLEKANYEIIEASNGDEGMTRACAEQPDLIISDVMMPLTDGIEFCWMIRENSPIPMVPFIFMTSLEDKDMEIRGFRAGADEYLVKPVERAVLLDKVEMLLERSRKVKSFGARNAKSVKGFEGKLADLSLAELIQLLNLNQRSGVLYIEARQEGEIVFHSGQMVFGRYGDLTGEEAIYQVVPENTGTFRFEPGEKEVERNISGATMNVLIEACRLDDEKDLQE